MRPFRRNFYPRRQLSSQFSRKAAAFIGIFFIILIGFSIAAVIQSPENNSIKESNGWFNVDNNEWKKIKELHFITKRKTVAKLIKYSCSIYIAIFNFFYI